MLDHEDIEEILKLLDATPFKEFELETERFKSTLRRESGGGWTQEHETRRIPAKDAAAATPAADVTPGAANAAAANAAAAAPGPALGMRADAWDIRAPLVGTFYRSPRPGAPPFVEPGTRVGADTVVAIVETMKLMTSVCAGNAGQIAEILVSDGEFIAQDQLLMRVVPAAP